MSTHTQPQKLETLTDLPANSNNLGRTHQPVWPERWFSGELRLRLSWGRGVYLGEMGLNVIKVRSWGRPTVFMRVIFTKRWSLWASDQMGIGLGMSRREDSDLF